MHNYWVPESNNSKASVGLQLYLGLQVKSIYVINFTSSICELHVMMIFEYNAVNAAPFEVVSHGFEIWKSRAILNLIDPATVYYYTSSWSGHTGRCDRLSACDIHFSHSNKHWVLCFPKLAFHVCLYQWPFVTSTASGGSVGYANDLPTNFYKKTVGFLLVIITAAQNPRLYRKDVPCSPCSIDIPNHGFLLPTFW